MTPEPTTYPGYRCPTEIIHHAVWLYYVFGLSLRDVELILAERGITVAHESILRWCLKFGGEVASRLRRRRPRPGNTWHLDEVFLRIGGTLHYLWRAGLSDFPCLRPYDAAEGAIVCRDTNSP